MHSNAKFGQNLIGFLDFLFVINCLLDLLLFLIILRQHMLHILNILQIRINLAHIDFLLNITLIKLFLFIGRYKLLEGGRKIF